MTSRDRYRSIVDDLATKARVSLPESHGRIDSAIKLVLSNDVELHDDGTATVGSRTNPAKTYSGVNGTCSCVDFSRAPDGWCSHRIARALQLRADRAMRTLLDAEASNGTLEGRTDDEKAERRENTSTGTSQDADPALTSSTQKNGASTPAVPPEFVVWISGHPFIRFAGLLKMAHEQHLVGLSEVWTFNDESVSLAHSVAVFADGRRFEGSGDSAPSNVGKKVALHWRRVALTRAKSRALRDALNCDMVAVEELGEMADG
jgi:hypothetical protein